jgi:hypothetical protein
MSPRGAKVPLDIIQQRQLCRRRQDCGARHAGLERPLLLRLLLADGAENGAGELQRLHARLVLS